MNRGLPPDRERRNTPAADSPLRVLMVSDWFFPKTGGIEWQVRDLACQLQHRGHRVSVLTPTPGPAEESGIPVIRLRTGRFPFFGFMCTPAGFRRLAEHLRKTAPDVVHIHLSYVAPAAFAAAAFCRRQRIPAVVTFHSILDRFAAVLAAADRLAGWSRWPLVFSTVSRRVAADLTGRGIPVELHPAPNGIDPGWWQAANRPETSPKDPVKLVTVMRLSPRKRALALVDMMDRLVARPAVPPVTLTIIGDGLQRRKLAQAIMRRGLQSVIHLAGYRSREEIRRIFSRSDIFVMPSRLESFGIAALEACCAGLPVVAMSASGIAEWLTDGLNGLIADDDAHMIDCLSRLVMDVRLRESIRRHNRCQALPFSWDRVVARHLSLYRAAIGRAAPGPAR